LTVAATVERALGRGAFGRVGWSGPRPILGHGPHAYVFQLVALARPLGLDADAGLADALATMTGAALARGRLDRLLRAELTAARARHG
jgi:phosphatidylethanolamine-binding protein (PEBP) family uncharacterized protein